MLGWTRKKNAAPSGDAPDRADDRPAMAETADPAAAIDWPARLQAAQGDDAALLALARDGAPLEVQQAAVDAVTDEAALKLAEREWRGHDRRLHRLVKQRYGVQVARRETRERAARLIDAATALREQSPLPTNRLVELDQGWQSLDAALLDPAQRSAYDALRAQLTALTHERGDQALKAERWAEAARQALTQLQRAGVEAAGTSDRAPLADAIAAARALLDGHREANPEPVAVGALRSALNAALQTSTRLGEQLVLLDALLQSPPADAAEPRARWESRAPLGDERLDALLTQRVVQWHQARDAAELAQRTARREQARERQRAADHEFSAALAAALDQGETALAAGHLGDIHRQLIAIDELQNTNAAPAAPTTLGTRIERLQAGYAQLKGWQHWGGGLARDELVLQAEALATVTQRGPAARGLKLSLRQQAEVIDDMRARWKELDRLGGATSRKLWQRFDAALKAAYAPVADHQTQQRAVRAQNLQSRQGLIEALNAVVTPDTSDPATPPDWKSLAGALDHFRTEWRKLGPLEHTVPHRARDELIQQMETAVGRLDAPLIEARRSAQSTRERLIARARSLADAARNGTTGRDDIDKVRELQAEWQQQARTLPLARAAETALWSEFKAAVDAVFSAREAAHNAREMQFKAAAGERIALIERLDAVPADAPPAELKRALAETETAWQRAGPAPRQHAAALDARFRSAREMLRERLAHSARRQWQATCDALSAKLALCVALEDDAEPAAARAELPQRWTALPVLPPGWEQALAARAGLIGAASSGAPSLAAVPCDELLLQLEMALGLATPPAFEGARRDWKLRAMKAALEGRQHAAAAAPGPAQMIGALLDLRMHEAGQRERFAAVLEALRNGEPLSALG